MTRGALGRFQCWCAGDDVYVRKVAAAALRKIDPEAAAKAGVKRRRWSLVSPPRVLDCYGSVLDDANRLLGEGEFFTAFRRIERRRIGGTAAVNTHALQTLRESG